MKVSAGGFRYAIQHEDKPGEWRTSASGDELRLMERFFEKQNPREWRLLDQTTGVVLAGKGSTL